MSKSIIEISDGSHPVVDFLKYYSEKLNLGWNFKTLRDWLPAEIQSADLVLIDLARSCEILSDVPLVPAQIKTFGCFDSVIRENEHMMPRNLFYDSLELFFVERARELDIRAPAFIIGDSEESRTVALFIASRGIRSIYLVGNTQKLKSEIAILKRVQIGIDFKAVAAEDMTLQVASAGLLVNTIDLSDNIELMTDLSYFNFMKRDSYVFDLCQIGRENVLLQEADRAGLKILKKSDFLEVFVRECLKRVHSDYKPLIWESYKKENYS